MMIETKFERLNAHDKTSSAKGFFFNMFSQRVKKPKELKLCIYLKTYS